MPVVYVFLVIFNTCTYVACLHKLIIYGNYKNNKKQSLLFIFFINCKIKKEKSKYLMTHRNQSKMDYFQRF